MLWFIDKMISYTVGQVMFQYILCYGLSHIWTEEQQIKYVFQYILCYGLSENPVEWRYLAKVSIHPMLRFICLPEYTASPAVGFNTSYVTVYQSLRSVSTHTTDVSIHPMLRFIGNVTMNLII